MRYSNILFGFIFISCGTSHAPSLGAPPKGSSTVVMKNETDASATVNFSFGADSAVLPKDWNFCTATAKLNCGFQIAPHGSQPLPLNGKYLNATVTFNDLVGCGSTKAELNLNNPKWYDILDISLVDGYSNKIKIAAGQTTLGPPLGKDGNEKVVGLFPYGCDICTGRQSPPCGIPPGGLGCKSGSQYKPDVICQWQGSVMGGGTPTIVSLIQ
jgi:hypothetical protein